MANIDSNSQSPVKSRESIDGYFKPSERSQNIADRFEKKLDSDEGSDEKKLSTKEVVVIEEKSTKPPPAKGNKKKKKKETAKKKKEVHEKLTGDKSAAKKSPSELKETFRQSTITSHFPVRRSNRRSKSVIQIEKDKIIMQKLLDEDESGLEIRVLPDKGRGIFAMKEFKRGDLICEYAGELIDYSIGKTREIEYSQDAELGCYSYFFQYKSKKYCVDATKETNRLGRLLNHSKTQSNVCTRVFPIKDTPRLILVANRDVKIGEELLYDYGERSKVAIQSHPWLQQ